MKQLITAVVTTITLLGAMTARASAGAEAQVKGAKGPVQITLKLHKTTVKVGKSLWYKLELKNIGKEKILVHDRLYKDPWVIHENCRSRRGIYIEILKPNGKPLKVRWGGGSEQYDWAPKPGGTLHLTVEESKELDDLQSQWKQSGMTAQEQSIATSRWGAALVNKKNMAEDGDDTKKLWLKPGASTATFAWANRDPDLDANYGEEAQVGDYTQLWSYRFRVPGKYRIRAVYDHVFSESYKKELLGKKIKVDSAEWWVKATTPFVEFEVLP
jgi:hypothetical protein